MNFTQWQEFSRNISDRARNAQNMKFDRAFKLAETVGLPRHAGCIHNAAIDDDMTGWCHRNPQRLKIAKKVNHMLNDWSITHLADKIVSRYFKQSI